MAGSLRQRQELPASTLKALEDGEEHGTTDSAEYKAATLVYFQKHMCRLDPWPAPLLESFAYRQQDDTVFSTLFGGSSFHLTGPMKHYDVTDELSLLTETTVPGGVLLMKGLHDACSDEAMRPFFTQPKACVKWVSFEESSHMAQLEETERFLSVLGDFLNMAKMT